MTNGSPGDRTRWQAVDELFSRALELPRGERSGFLDGATGDAEVRNEVEALLRAADDASEFLEGREGVASSIARLMAEYPRWGDSPSEGEDPSAGIVSPKGPDRSGERLGSWELLEQIGRGGMASVYRARRVDGGFEQEVALKVIRKGLDTDDVIRRFEGERDILSALHHPNIASLLDGGVTPDGLPYFVMERVRGSHITRYVDEKGLTVKDRLRLFLEVADIVAFAHRNLVVHKDLKPSNIMITDDGHPVLLDFGIAKLLDDSDEKGDLTRTGARWITPGYGAPEQILGHPVTTATDVYQLGVLLFELLVGERPFPTKGRSTFEVERAICREDPPKPSTRAEAGTGSDETANPDPTSLRRTDRTSLRRILTGDLDAIVLKALRKEPQERYASVEAMARDVRRYLAAEPVEATRGGTAYKARKFLRRNPGSAATAALILFLLVAYAATLTLQAKRIAEERDRAALESEKATRVTEFLTGLMESADPQEAQGEEVTVLEVLEQGVAQIGTELGDQPDVQAELYLVTGTVYQNIGDLASADSLLRRAVVIREELYGEGPSDELAEVQIALGRNHLGRGDLAEAESLMRTALDHRRELHPDGDELIADGLAELGEVQRALGKYDESEETFREAIGIYQALPQPPQVSLGVTHNNLALVYHGTGRFREAEDLYNLAIPAVVDSLGSRHPWSLSLLHNLAGFNRTLGRFAESDSLFRIVVEADRAVAPQSPNTGGSMANLGMTLRLRGHLEGADSMLTGALELLSTLGTTHPAVTLRLANLAHLRVDQGRGEEALSLSQEMVRRSAERDGGTAATSTLLRHGRILWRLGRHAEALDVLSGVLESRREDYEAPHRAIAEVLDAVALVHYDAGELDESIRTLREVAAMRRDIPGDEPTLVETLARLAEVLRTKGDLAEAEEVLIEAETLAAENLPSATLRRLEVQFERARLLLAQDQPADAARILDAVRPFYERQFTPDHPRRRTLRKVEGLVDRSHDGNSGHQHLASGPGGERRQSGREGGRNRSGTQKAEPDM